MAAKQGISATITQTSADALNTTLSRLPPNIRSHSWLHNMNTTCTIKSAPPRTLEVMTLLSTHSGYLVKRNEQHVWQKRWCCVVPHTFLYYFDAEKEGGDPVGIIDLECYTSVNADKELQWELCGDSITNPDLRSFWFQSSNIKDCDEWRKALLMERHSALRDERDAYHQVCETFPLQLSHLSDEIDDGIMAREEVEKELYRVRSQVEEGRRSVVNIVRDVLERVVGGRWVGRLERVVNGEVVVGMNAGVSEAVSILAECCEVMMGEKKRLYEENKALKSELVSNPQKIDVSELTSLKREFIENDRKGSLEKKRAEERIASLENLLQKTREGRESYANNLRAKEMEFNLLSKASKEKIYELGCHKKILKREVIDLRKKVDEIDCDVTAYRHKSLGLDEKVKAERERNNVLERHLDQVVSQIKMQEKLMDCMLSQTGGSAALSIQGGSVCFNSEAQSIVSDLRHLQNNSGDNLSVRSEMKFPPTNRRYPPLSNYSYPNTSTKDTINCISTTLSNSNNNEVTPNKSQPIAAAQGHIEIIRTATTSSSGNSTTLAGNPVALESPEMHKITPAVFDAITTPESSQKSVNKNTTKDNILFPQQQPQKSIALVKHINGQPIPSPDHQYFPHQHNDDSSIGSLSALTEDRTQIGSMSGFNNNNHRNPKQSSDHHHVFHHHNNNNTFSKNSNIDAPTSIGTVPVHKHMPILSRSPVAEDSLSIASKNARPPLLHKQTVSSLPQNHTQLSIPAHERLNVPPPRHRRCHSSSSYTKSNDEVSVSSSSSRLSVAQRARLEAETSSNIVPSSLIMEPKTKANNNAATKESTATSVMTTSFFSSWGRTLSDAMDNSILGIKGESDRSENTDKNTADSNTNASEVSPRSLVGSMIKRYEPETKTSLCERQKAQKEQQLIFLKQRGLYKNDDNDSYKNDDNDLYKNDDDDGVASPEIQPSVSKALSFVSVPHSTPHKIHSTHSLK